MKTALNCFTAIIASATVSFLAAAQITSQTRPNPGSVGTVPSPLGTVVRCPAAITAQATNAPSPWFPSAVQMTAQSAALTHASAQTPQMLCNYAGSGSQWQIGRNIQPEFKRCTPSGTQFLCFKN
jgi:hypothetical protein